jgi:hypothetical protein
MAELSERRRAIALLDRELREYYPRKAAIKGEIARTFPYVIADGPTGAPVHHVTQWTCEGAPIRAGLFAELDRLNEVYGPVISQRRDIQAEANALAKAIERIQQAAERKQQKQPRQQSLF